MFGIIQMMANKRNTVITCILPALDVSPHLDFTLIAVGSCQFNPPLNFTRIFEFNPHSNL